MIRTYKYRLFTNSNQERELSITLETHRRLYNAVLDGKMLCWEAAGSDWGLYDQSHWFTIKRKLDQYYSRINVHSARQTLRRLDKAYKLFYSRCRARSGRVGHPRFKGRDRFNSFTLVDNGGGWKIVDGRLRLRYIGTIRIRWHRELPVGTIKQVTILKENGKWFACFMLELPDAKPSTLTTGVGIDVGLKSFVTTSDREQLGDSRTLENQLPELRLRQRALSRCKRGSNRRRLVKQRVTRLHAKVRNTRRDLHHKVARSLIDRYGTIAAESLNVTSMLKNRRLARRIKDAGWCSFILILASKAASAGCRVILVDAKNTSQQCSNCGAIVRKSLAVRVHRCECGCVLDRDVNAAKNVLARAAPNGLNDLVAGRGHKSPCHTAAE